MLESYITESDNEFMHIMQQADLYMSYGEACDTIDISEIRFSISKVSGFIWRSELKTGAISTKQVGNNIEMCK